MFVRKRRLIWEELVSVNEKDNASSQYYADILKRIFLNNSNDKKKVFLITSPADREGKTTTAINMAAMLAKGGKKTLLVDANFKNPMAEEFFGTEGRKGLGDILTGNSNIEKVLIQDRFLPDLYLLSSGTVGGDSLGISLSNNFGSFIEKIGPHYQFVIIDSSSVNSSPDPVILGKYADGIVFVVLCDKTQKSEVLFARDRILKNQGKIIGVVLNRIPKYMPSSYLT